MHGADGPFSSIIVSGLSQNVAGTAPEDWQEIKELLGGQ
jgi:hypothetical protein